MIKISIYLIHEDRLLAEYQQPYGAPLPRKGEYVSFDDSESLPALKIKFVIWMVYPSTPQVTNIRLIVEDVS